MISRRKHINGIGFMLAAGLLLLFAAWLFGHRFGDSTWPVDSDGVTLERTW